ncbi:hypothetical protein GCM10008905_22000 [Clostridium malenominatum]|uniref:DUF4179 domain-containing protein n=1 Tax=Clostridium malenominatum TaxID=1539 RepID=A0ABN1J1L0_9CLOT
MKSVYEHFNDITLDLNSIENEVMDIDDVTMKRIKNRFKSSINKNYRGNRKRKYRVWVASLLLALGVSAVMLNNSVLADKIGIAKAPYINTLFSKFNYSGKFEDYTQVIGESVKDKGYEVTLNEITMDDYSLMIIYTIKTEEKIEDIINKAQGPFPYAPSKSIKINNKEIRGGAGGRHEIIDQNTVQVMMDYEIKNNDIPDDFTMDISFNEIGNVKGNWAFKFDATKGKMRDSIKSFDVNTKYTFIDGKGEEIELVIDKITFSSISTAITFKADKEFEYSNIKFRSENDFNERGASLSCNSLRLGYKYEGLYKFDYVEEIPEKIIIEYNKKDESKVVIGEISLKE